MYFVGVNVENAGKRRHVGKRTLAVISGNLQRRSRRADMRRPTYGRRQRSLSHRHLDTLWRSPENKVAVGEVFSTAAVRGKKGKRKKVHDDVLDADELEHLATTSL